MTSEEAGRITRLLHRARDDRKANDDLIEVVYEQLRKMAHARVARRGPGQTIRTTDLVHEAWLRLAGGDEGFEGRAHFFGAAAKAMRNILVDQARRRSSLKRDASRRQELDTDPPALEPAAPVEDVLSLNEALESLEQEHPRPAQVVELRFFAGLKMTEIAEMLEISVATAERDWRFARSWLQREMGVDEDWTEEHDAG